MKHKRKKIKFGPTNVSEKVQFTRLSLTAWRSIFQNGHKGRPGTSGSPHAQQLQVARSCHAAVIHRMLVRHLTGRKKQPIRRKNWMAGDKVDVFAFTYTPRELRPWPSLPVWDMHAKPRRRSWHGICTVNLAFRLILWSMAMEREKI